MARAVAWSCEGRPDRISCLLLPVRETTRALRFDIPPRALDRALASGLACLLLALALVACGAPPAATPPPPPDDPPAAAVQAPTIVHGRVEHADGRPAAGAWVALTGPSAWDGMGPLATVASTHDDGVFFFAELSPGPYGVTAGGPGATDVVVDSITIADPPEPLPGMTIRLARGGFSVTGTVRDADGTPMPGAQVDAVEVLPRAPGPAHAAIADREGRFTLTLSGSLPYLLVASAHRRARTMVRCDPKSQTVDIALSGEGVPPPEDDVVAAWLRAGAIPLRGVDPGADLDDLAPLQVALADARVVALGEVTHGSSEIFRVKHRLLELLVERMGFSVLAVEVGRVEAAAVDAYVHGGPGDPRRLVWDLQTDPFKTEEMVDVVTWMRRYNADPRHAKKLSFAGFDLTVWTSVRELLAYLRDRGVGTGELTAQLAPLSDVDANATYPEHSEATQEAARRAITEVIDVLERRHAELAKNGGEDLWQRARDHARDVQDAERSFRDPTLRDSLMAARVLDLAGDDPTRKVALWLHNAHASAFPFMFEDMGRRLRDRLGNRYLAIGTAFGDGSFRALDANNQIAVATVGRPKPGTFDAALALAELPIYAIDLRTAGGRIRDWLRGPVPAWSVGFRFLNEDMVRPHIVPGLAFDVVVYLDHVEAARALARP